MIVETTGANREFCSPHLRILNESCLKEIRVLNRLNKFSEFRRILRQSIFLNDWDK